MDSFAEGESSWTEHFLGFEHRPEGFAKRCSRIYAIYRGYNMGAPLQPPETGVSLPWLTGVFEGPVRAHPLK
jgi:hypothetical protein